VHRLLALILLVTAPAALAQQAYVLDGDTLDLAGERIRLWRVDAPEGSQVCQRAGRAWACGADATAALETLVARARPDVRRGRPGPLRAHRGDVRGGRPGRRCRDGAAGLGARLRAVQPGAYAAEQLEAEQAQRGLWSGSFVPPWEWRRGEGG
jgi:endonuclease YncB( thermonuclease family)